MFLISREIMAQRIVRKYRKQLAKLQEHSDWENIHSHLRRHEPNRRIFQLVELGDQPHPDTVCRILGKSKACDVGYCQECNRPSETLIVLGPSSQEESEITDDTGEFRICKECLFQAIRIHDGE